MEIIEISYEDKQRTAIRYSDGIEDKWVYADIKEEWDRFLLENKEELQKFDGEWFLNKDIIDARKKSKIKFPLYAKVLLTIVLLLLASGIMFHFAIVRGETNIVSKINPNQISGDLELAGGLMVVALMLFYNLTEVKTWKTKRKVLWGFTVGSILFIIVFSLIFVWAFIKTDSIRVESNLALDTVPVGIGIGTLDISFNLPVPLYRSKSDKLPFDTLSFEKQKDGTISFQTKHLNSLLNPYKMSGGDSDERANEHSQMGLIAFPAELTFRVLEAKDTYYHIVVNEDTRITAVIRKDPDYAILPQRELFGFSNFPNDKPYKGYYIFETWEHLLLRAEFIKSYSEMGEVYDEPNGKIIFKNLEQKFLPYNVTQVKGEWIKIKKGFGREFNFEGLKNAEGWIKWTNGKEMLIDITEYTIE
jgi:hypothetical protein